MARKNKKKKTLAFKNAVAGYLFIAPFIIGFILFLVVPLVQSLRMSFSTVELEGGLSMTWAGLENYRQAFLVDEQFVPNLISELVKMLTNVPATLIFSFFIALLLNQSFKGRGAVRAIFFLPVILSSGVIVGLESGNTLLADMKDAIEATNNNTSITGVLESILVMYLTLLTVYMILRLPLVSRLSFSFLLCRRFHQVCSRRQKSRDVLLGKVSGRLHFQW